MKKTILAIIVAIIIAGGGVVAYMAKSNNKNEESSQSETADAMKKTEDGAMMKDSEEEVIEKTDSDSMEKSEDDGAMMEKQSGYITVADFNKDKSGYDDSTKVYFFHASWCPICQGIEKEINADMSRIPEGTVLIKTDFDDNTELRQQYGVTTQYTFVQVDNQGNQIAKWSATSLEKAIDGIQS